GDTAEEAVVLDLGGNVRFADDGPAIDAAVTDGDAVTLTTFDAETVGGTSVDVSVADFGGAFSVASSDYGADGAGSIAWEYGLVIDNATSGLTSDGVPVELSMNGDVVEGRANGVLVFTVAVDADTGVVTLTQYEEIDHDLPGSDSNYDSQLEALADDVLSLSGTATITDGDGDTAEETVLLDLGGNIQFADDGPRAFDNLWALLDDDALTGGNAGGTGDDADNANTSGTLGHDFGADGAGSIAFQTTGAPAGFQYVASGSDILIQQDQGNGFVTVITVTLDPLTGDYTVTQNLPVMHADGDAENNVFFTLRYIVTDGDGDTAYCNLRISVDDDTPEAVDGVSSGTVDEDGLAGNPGGNGDVAGEATVATGSVTSLFSAGADSPLTFGLDTAAVVSYLESLGLQTHGNDLSYELNGDTITATIPNATIFTFTLSSNGDWEFQLLCPLDHPTAGTEDDIVIDFGPLIQATDADGDTVNATGSVLITVDDDTPVADPDTNSLTEDTASVGGNVITDDSFGGDMAGDPAVVGVTGFNGVAGTVNGGTQGEFGFLQLNEDGTYTYSLDTTLVQGLDDGESETDSFTYTIVDADGDTSTTTLIITINGVNDRPDALDDTNWVLDVTIGPDPTTSGNVLQDIAHPGAPSGTFADVADTDVDGDTLTVTAINGGSVGASLGGSYGSIVINADGSYTYTLDSDNTDVIALNEGDTLTDTFQYRVSDGTMTDWAFVTITIFGTNDAPVLTPDAVTVSEEGLPGGNPDNVGNPTDTTDSFTASGQIGIVDPDSSSFQVTLSIPTTPGLTSAGLPIIWQLSPDGQALVGSTTEGTVILIGIDDTGAYTVDLVGQIDHSDTSSEDTVSFGIDVSVSDGSATTTLTNGITVTIEDDSPIIGDMTPDSVTIGNFDNATGTGTFDYSPGGDGHGEFQITYTGTPIDGLTYTLTQLDNDNDGQNDGAILTASANGTDVYTLEVDVDGNYTYTLLAPDTGSSETISLSNLSAGGPGFRELEDDPSTALNEAGRIEFSSNGNGVNASTPGFGVSNQWTDPGEFFTMEFHAPGTVGNDAPQVDADILTGLSLTVQQVRGGPTDFRWTVTRYNDDGTVAETETGVLTVSSTGVLEIPATISFSELRLENIDSSGSVRFDTSVTVERSILPQDLTLDFDISATDSDGDTTSVSDLSIFIDADITSAATIKVLDDTLMADAEVVDMAMFASASTAQQDGSRMMARATEATAIAASAAAFAMPTIEAGFEQDFGQTASAGDLMVNFEFAAAPTLEAPQMPEGYAIAFDGRVELDAGAGQDIGMANILGNGGDFQAAMGDAVAAPDMGGFEYAAADEGFTAMPSAFEGLAIGDAGSAMEALLMLEANPPAADAAELADAGKALGEAVADLAAEAQVDNVVAHFAANDTGAGNGDAISVPVEGLLDGMIGNDLPFHTVGIAQTDQTDEAALVAASA
ncbi:MAG: hypothetical protein HKO08_10235, partial [Erythrobacter sp.]|nr:hypothetical protein [Erythrobacter sp.]